VNWVLVQNRSPRAAQSMPSQAIWHKLLDSPVGDDPVGGCLLCR